MFKVYVSGPLTASNDEEEQNNIDRAMEAGDLLAREGIAVYVPHVTWYMDEVAKVMGRPTLNYKYLKQDKEWIRYCNAVLRLPGESKGGDIETVYASKLGIPVYHTVQAVLDAKLEYCRLTKEKESENYIEMPPHPDIIGDELSEEEIVDQQGQSIITYSTGAKETDIGTRFDLLPMEGLLAAAKIAYEGAKKYGEENWRQGMPCKTMLNHALKHITQYLLGDETEEHLAHAAWRLLASLECKKRWPELDEEDIPYDA